MAQFIPQRGYLGGNPAAVVLRGFNIGATVVIADVVTRGYGQFPRIPMRGYYSGTEPPPIPPTPINPAGPTGGFDAGPGEGFGKWFNLAYAPASPRARGRRETEIGRLLDELVYSEADKAAFESIDAADAGEAREVVRSAVQDIEANAGNIDNRRSAHALVEEHRIEWQSLTNLREELASRLFLLALVEEAKAQWQAARMVRIAQDDADLLILMQGMI